MSENFLDIFDKLSIGDDNIFTYRFINTLQQEEIKLRESVATLIDDGYLEEVAKHHSIPVMDKEVKRFLSSIPKDGIIIDGGGGWGWHWRNLSRVRPDIRVVIIDFVKGNLINAQNILGDIINSNIFLVLGDLNDLQFPDNSFHGYWSVQTFQHIPDFSRAVNEAHRVLKSGGVFSNYSLNNNRLVNLVYNLVNLKYHVKGQVAGSFYLARASEEQKIIISNVFQNDVKSRYSEILFEPDLKLKNGKENSLVAKFDSMLSMDYPLFSKIARQQSFSTIKI